MKRRRNPYRLFFGAVMLVTLVVGLFVRGVEGQDWMQPYRPFAQFFVGLIEICLGPWLLGTALKARDREGTLSVWKKSWPVTFAGGILVPMCGVVMLWN